MLQFRGNIVLILKLDTSGAQTAHQYENRFINPSTFEWTSQNRMRHKNEAGRAIVEHEKRGTVIRLFVQASSHAEACYVGPVHYVSSKGDGPMSVRLALESPAPKDVTQLESKAS